MTISGRNGFSLVMTIVAVAIIGVLSIALSNLLIDAKKGQLNVQASIDFDSVKNSLNLITSTSACKGAFKADTAGTTNLTLLVPSTAVVKDDILVGQPPVDVKLVTFGGSPIINMADPIISGTKITKLQITRAIYDGPETVGGIAYKALVVGLLLEATKATGSFGSRVTSRLFTSRLLARASDGQVDDCTGTPVVKRGRETCPAGFTMVGTSGEANAFCISGRLGQSNLEAAMQNCLALSGEPGELCRADEWMHACTINVSNMKNHGSNTNAEYVAAGSELNLMGVQNNCHHADNMPGNPSTTHAYYRCCLH